MVNTLDFDRVVRAMAGALRCVLRQDTLLSVPLSAHVYEYVPCKGLREGEG